ncbi:MAG: hypothetical protein NXY57DRAFT_1068609 [Lentinula lateritia]|nr:MAG: hypothetical protein NXY57DRAFT_1068609 [Lentinula lateritia]
MAKAGESRRMVLAVVFTEFPSAYLFQDFFKGKSADPDRRISDEELKLLKSKNFSPEFDKKVDMCKVNLTFIRPWIAKKVVELVGFEDEVVAEYAMGFLKDKQEPIPILYGPKIIKDNTTNTVSHVNQSAHPFDKGPLKALLSRRYFYALAFEIYGGNVSLVCTITDLPTQLSKPTSLLNGRNTSSWRNLRSNSTLPSRLPLLFSGLVARFADWKARLAGGSSGQAAAPAKEDEKAKKKKNKAAKAAAVPLGRRGAELGLQSSTLVIYVLRPL